MHIERVLFTRAHAGYYFDDLAAIRGGAEQDGFFYLGEPETPGHSRIRQPGEAISIVLILSDGQVAHGDAVSIQYSGVVGRDPAVFADRYLQDVARYLVPIFEGAELTTMRDMCAQLEAIRVGDRKLHTGLRYGMSQALLDAIAKATRRTMAEVVAEEWATELTTDPIPVLAQSGDDRYVAADKMILKRVEALPQGLFNSISKIGSNGELLTSYVAWLSDRIARFGGGSYHPTIHLDVYGTVARIFDDDVKLTANYLSDLEAIAAPYPLRIEAPVDAPDRDSVLRNMVALRAELSQRSSQVQIAADDWCNSLSDVSAFVDAGAADMIQVKAPDLGSLDQSIEAVILCQQSGVGAFLGGTCNGTDKSSRVTVNIAMATSADLVYNKPGMGVDEGLMIVRNEMARVKLLVEGRQVASAAS